MNNSLTWWQIIYEQLGAGTLFMLGAQNKCYNETEKNISFRIRGSRAVNYIKISLSSLDLYNIEFGKIHGAKYKVVNQISGIYFDQLHDLIESNTGLSTRVPKVHFSN